MRKIAIAGVLASAFMLSGGLEAVRDGVNYYIQKKNLLRAVFADASSSGIDTLNNKYPLTLQLSGAQYAALRIKGEDVQACRAELGYDSIDFVEPPGGDAFDSAQAATGLKLAVLRPLIASADTADDALKTNMFAPAVALHIPQCKENISYERTPSLDETASIYNCALDKAFTMTGQYLTSSLRLRP